MKATELPSPHTHRGATPAALLEVKGATIRYGGVQAVTEASFEVEDGELHGLIGPNGAGKTSLVDALTGFERLAEGMIMFKAQRIEGWPPHKRARAGLVRTFQHLELYGELTVRQNLRAAADVTRQNSLETVERIADMLEVRFALDETVRELPHGVRRRVSLGRALATAPQMLILDEPASGLDSSETRELGNLLRRIIAEGVTMLLIDHDMSLVMRVCDRITVLDQGQVLVDGPPREVAIDPRVQSAYLGSHSTVS